MKNYKLKNALYISSYILLYVLVVVFLNKISSISFINNYKYKYFILVFLYAFFLFILNKSIFCSFSLFKTIYYDVNSISQNKNVKGDIKLSIYKNVVNYYIIIFISHINFYSNANNNIPPNIEIRIPYFKLLKIMRFKSPKRFIKSDVNCLKLFLSLGLNEIYDLITLNNEELKKEIRKNKIKSII
jgi:hypothetical protein